MPLIPASYESDVHRLLLDGARSEQLGVTDRALSDYLAAESLAGDAAVRAQALTGLARVHRTRCDWDAALAAARQAQEATRDPALAKAHAHALISEANIHIARGDFARAMPLLERVLERTTDRQLHGIALQNIGSVRAQQGELSEAESAYGRSLEAFTEAGYDRGVAIALNNLGRVLLDRGDWREAHPVLERALVAARESEAGELVAITLANLGEAIVPLDALRAEELICTAMGYFQANGNRLRQVECLRLVGEIAARQRRAVDARRCYRRALELAHSIGAALEIAQLERALAAIGEASEWS